MSISVFNELNSSKSIPNVLETWSIRFLPRFVTYSPRLNITIDTPSYTLKTATHIEELLSVFRLRYENFLEAIKGDDASYDLDEFDHQCDHLIIIDKVTQNIIGTYRILCSLFTKNFYSQHEFEIDNFLKQPGIKLELGRACIDPYHRNGLVIDLLWRGIAKYFNETNAQYLFGCSSVKTENPQVALDIYRYLKAKGSAHEYYGIKPTQNFSMDYSACHDESLIDVKNYIPSLLKNYLTAGAKVIGTAAFDKEFECIDFFTLLERDEITKMFYRRYFA